MDAEVRDNRDRRRFELALDGGIVFADYSRADGIIRIHHVEAPPMLRGTGAAGRLMRGIVDIARAEGARIRPYCGYAHSWMRRHPEAQGLMA